MPPDLPRRRRLVRRNDSYFDGEDVELEQVPALPEPPAWEQGETWARLEEIGRDRHENDAGRRWPLDDT